MDDYPPISSSLTFKRKTHHYSVFFGEQTHSETRADIGDLFFSSPHPDEARACIQKKEGSPRAETEGIFIKTDDAGVYVWAIDEYLIAQDLINYHLSFAAEPIATHIPSTVDCLDAETSIPWNYGNGRHWLLQTRIIFIRHLFWNGSDARERNFMVSSRIALELIKSCQMILKLHNRVTISV